MRSATRFALGRLAFQKIVLLQSFLNKKIEIMKRIILASVLVFAGLACQAQEKEVIVVITTNYGTIKAKLYNETPKHRDNFIKIANEGWYNGSPFHRVIKEFMIQGGQNADGRMDPGYKVDAEFNSKLFHKKGALGAARQGDNVNPKKASSGSQFYIVQGKVYDDATLDMMEERTGHSYSLKQRQTYKTIGGTPFLDGEYTVFGEVTEGLDVVDKDAAGKTGYMDVPIEPVTITSVKIEK